MLTVRKKILISAIFSIAIFCFIGFVYGQETIQAPENLDVYMITSKLPNQICIGVTTSYSNKEKANFKIFRRAGENGLWETAYQTSTETVGVSLSDYKANNVGTTYYYYVTAIKNGQESEPTAIKSLTLSWTDCSDSDAASDYRLGEDYYTRGTHKSDTDYCVDDKKLHEFFCGINDQSFNLYHICPEGCRDGACINASTTKEAELNPGGNSSEVATMTDVYSSEGATSTNAYVLKEGKLGDSGNSYDGAYPNYSKGYAYINFMALSKNPTFPSGTFQSTPSGSPYFRNLNDYGHEPLKIAWTSAGDNYGEGDLTLEENATITVNFDNNPITIYLPKIPLCTEKTHPAMDLENPECWRKTERKFIARGGECPDKWNFQGICANYEGAHYLYVAKDGSTYWDAKLTKLARAAIKKDPSTDPKVNPQKNEGESSRVMHVDINADKIKNSASLLQQNKLEQILAEIKELRDIVKEQAAEIKYLRSIKEDVQNLSDKEESAINNFITYGVDNNTKKLGAGERAAVIYSFKKAFKKLPETEDEIADAIKIAQGRWPSQRSEEAEEKAQAQFQKIYKKIPDMNNPTDNAAIVVMSYGLRQKAENRNLESEKNGIKIFKAIYGKSPENTAEWNIMQAITYSGASQGKDTDKDLLIDSREIELGTDPNNKDTDGDGYSDGVEVANGYDPLKK